MEEFKGKTPMMSQQKPIFIFGASGHAKVVIDIVEQEGRYSIHGLFDDNQALWGKELFGYEILGGIDSLKNEESDLLVAIGENVTRCNLAIVFKQHGFSFGQAIHPSAAISKGVKIGMGTVVMAGVAINADAEIHEHVIINTGASVDHDCLVREAAHIAPGAHLCGNVIVGERTLVGAGATIIPNIQIGSDVVIGAGATVVRNIPDGVTAIGTPARIMER
jgi:sugar O-acyltransferase (sialic acid O-acetyltransferase NeuD family)